jgi:hypothetical protein
VDVDEIVANCWLARIATQYRPRRALGAAEHGCRAVPGAAHRPRDVVKAGLAVRDREESFNLWAEIMPPIEFYTEVT